MVSHATVSLLSFSSAFSQPFSIFLLSLIHVFPSPYRLAASALNFLFASLFGLCCYVAFKFPAIFQRPRPHKRSEREGLIKGERLREWIGEDSIISLSHVSLHVVVIATCLPLVCIITCLLVAMTPTLMLFVLIVTRVLVTVYCILQ